MIATTIGKSFDSVYIIKIFKWNSSSLPSPVLPSLPKSLSPSPTSPSKVKTSPSPQESSGTPLTPSWIPLMAAWLQHPSSRRLSPWLFQKKTRLPLYKLISSFALTTRVSPLDTVNGGYAESKLTALMLEATWRSQLTPLLLRLFSSVKLPNFYPTSIGLSCLTNKIGQMAQLAHRFAPVSERSTTLKPSPKKLTITSRLLLIWPMSLVPSKHLPLSLSRRPLLFTVSLLERTMTKMTDLWPSVPKSLLPAP